MPTPSSSSDARGHVGFMDGLRGIAVLMVLCYHAHKEGLLPETLHLEGLFLELPSPFINQGFLGIYLFFFLSGFALFYPYAQHLFETRSLPTLKHYIDRRCSKILPSYILALTFLALVDLKIPPSESLFIHYIRHLFFIHNLWDNSAISINGPFWTLALEVQFYVIFPLIAWCFIRAPILTFVTLVLISSTYRIMLELMHLSWIPRATDQLPAYLDLFGFGSFTAYLIIRERSRRPNQSQHEIKEWTTLACIAATFLYSIVSTQNNCLFPQECATWRNDIKGMMALLFCLMCIGIARGAPCLRELLGNPLLLWFSAVSYNLYIWNKEILECYRRYALPSMQGFAHPGTINALIILSVTLSIAWALTRYVEQPFLRKSLFNRLSRKERRANEPA